MVGREADGLRFSDIERGPDGEIREVRACLQTAGLEASLRVYTPDGLDELVRFFRGLAAGWRGWQGERAYESLEHELRLTATHDGHGHVRLAVRLWQSLVPDGWSVVAVVCIEPGEEMTRVAEDMADLLSPPES